MQWIKNYSGEYLGSDHRTIIITYTTNKTIKSNARIIPCDKPKKRRILSKRGAKYYKGCIHKRSYKIYELGEFAYKKL